MTFNEFDELPEELNHNVLHSNLLEFFTEYFTRSINSTYQVKISGYNIRSINDVEKYTCPITRLLKAKIIHFVNCHMENYSDFDLGIDIYGNFWIAKFIKGKYMYKQVYNVDEIVNSKNNFLSC